MVHSSVFFRFEKKTFNEPEKSLFEIETMRNLEKKFLLKLSFFNVVSKKHQVQVSRVPLLVVVGPV